MSLRKKQIVSNFLDIGVVFGLAAAAFLFPDTILLAIVLAFVYLGKVIMS